MSDNNVLPVGYVLRGPELTYKIVSVLGRGGFGITYLAEATVRVGNVSARMRFAIKEHFMSGECEREGESMRVVCSNPVRERVQSSLKDFISEARRLHKVGVDHPNIVKVNEVFEANGTAYYVMECLEGESLRAYVKRRGPLREEEMLAVMRPVVDAVRYLHAARMTHLDIKPDNIMLTHDEADRLRPVLIDFGLAKHYDKDGSPTSTINILGCSDGYAPMEQYAGITSFSPEADCYALGATMWFCLTGKTPKKSTDLVEGELAREIADEVSPATLEMISSACRLNRRERSFPGLTAPAGATPEWHAPSPASKTTLIDKPRRRLPWRAIAAAVIALPSLALIVALFAFRGCGSGVDVPVQAIDTIMEDTVVADVAEQAENVLPNILASSVDKVTIRYVENSDGSINVVEALNGQPVWVDIIIDDEQVVRINYRNGKPTECSLNHTAKHKVEYKNCADDRGVLWTVKNNSKLTDVIYDQWEEADFDNMNTIKLDMRYIFGEGISNSKDYAYNIAIAKLILDVNEYRSHESKEPISAGDIEHIIHSMVGGCGSKIGVFLYVEYDKIMQL